MEQNPQNPQKPKSSKVGMIAIILVIIAIIGGGYFVFSEKSTKDATKQEKKINNADNEATDDTETPELRNIRVALDGIMTLFDNGNPTRARTDIKPEEFKEVQAKIDKIKDTKIKKELTAKMDDISKASKGDGDMSKTADASNDSTVSSGENDNSQQ